MPEKPEGDKSTQPELSRLKRMQKDRKDDDYYPDMPKIDAGYLASFFFEIGPTSSTGMGPSPITHQELESWQRNTGIELNAWEARTIKRLSVLYINEMDSATKRDCPAPWMPENFEPDRAEVAKRMKESIKELMKL